MKLRKLSNTNIKKRVTAAVLVMAVFLSGSHSASASKKIDDANEKKDEAEENLNEVNQEIEDIKKLESMFKATPSVGYAFLIIRTCRDNYDDEYQAIGGRIKNWIEKEHCTELFNYL